MPRSHILASPNHADAKPMLSRAKGNTADKAFARYACVMLVCVYVGRIQELWPPLSALHLGILALIVGAFACFSAGFDAIMEHLRSSQGKKVVGIFIFCVLSIPLSVWPTRSIMFTFMEFGLVLVFWATLLICTRTKESVLLLIKTQLACSILLALASLSSGMSGRVAASGTYDPNDIALVLVCGLPFLKLMLSVYKNTLIRLALFASGALMLQAIVHTGSRGGLIGLIVVILFLLFADKTVSMSKKLLMVLVVGLGVYLLAPDMLWERMSMLSSPQGDYNMDTKGGRVEIWKRAISMMIDRPLTGIGAGAFAVADGLYQGVEAGKWSVTHNSFLEVGASIGAVGLFLFLSMLLTAFTGMLTLARSKDVPPGDLRPDMAIALAASLVGYCVSGFFLSQGFSSLVYLLIGLCMILSASAAKDGIILQAAPTSARRSHHNRAYHHRPQSKPVSQTPSRTEKRPGSGLQPSRSKHRSC